MAISLVKGQKISLTKEAGTVLTRISMGLGWDAQAGQSIDLDASCILFDATKNIVDAVWFRQLRSKDGSIQHTGDNRTGAGDGDDESINVDLSLVPLTVTSLVFTINSFSGHTFDQIENAFCRLVDLSTKKEIAKYSLSGGGKVTAQIMAKLYRHNNEWKMSAIGESANGQTFQDILPKILPYL